MTALMPPCVQSQENSPLNSEEKRTILLQLHELKSCRESTAVYEQYVARDREQDAREKANYERSLELEQEATRLATEKMQFYKDAYLTLTKKPGWWCSWGRWVFALGIPKCH